MLSDLDAAYPGGEFSRYRYLAKKSELEFDIAACEKRADTVASLIDKGELHKAQTGYTATLAREVWETAPNFLLACKREILHLLGVVVTVFATK